MAFFKVNRPVGADNLRIIQLGFCWRFLWDRRM